MNLSDVGRGGTGGKAETAFDAVGKLDVIDQFLMRLKILAHRMMLLVGIFPDQVRLYRAMPVEQAFQIPERGRG